MKKYTIEDFDKFEIIDGYINCPSGYYSSIKKFPEKCIFGSGCIFGEGCSFGERCIFGEVCIFGSVCIFGEGCRFGARCRFGAWCSFGEVCRFGDGCSYENTRVKKGKYFACDRIGSEKRKTYFFMDETEKMFVRAGCFFGTLPEFIERVKEVHAGTKFEKEYLMACELAKVVLGEKDETI